MNILPSRSKAIASLLVISALSIGATYANTTDNQTDTLSPVFPSTSLPFQVVIELAPFQLPVGIHSGVIGEYNGLWIFIAGRINGLHGFGPDPFPPDQQNTSVYVFNPVNGSFMSRSLSDSTSGLNQQQIDSLSVTSPEWYQVGKTVYMVGGYGVDTASGTFDTKPLFTAINLPGIVKWVAQGNANGALNSIRQLYNPLFQVTGGRMYKLGSLTALVFGHNFTGVYTSNSNGIYTEQVRRFKVRDNGKSLRVDFKYSYPYMPFADYRRRDLNVLPVIMNSNGHAKRGLVAYGGVFTEAGGVWTVPVIIDDNGNPTEANPALTTTFMQAMNQYECAVAGLYSAKKKNMYNIFFGGISYGFFNSAGAFQTDSEDPFVSQVTTIQLDKNGIFTQYIMPAQYPTILSTASNPGNQLLFGANAYFMHNLSIRRYDNQVIDLDHITKPTVIGYIVGGIQSTLANTNVPSDSAASPYIFTVTLIPT